MEIVFVYYMNKTRKKHMNFTYTVKTEKSPDETISQLTDDLKDIGFGVLETLDFKKILAEKGLEFEDNYKLMEVCNPNLAKHVLEANPDLGLLLPCTIAVYEKDNENFISLARPTSLLSMISETNLKFLGEEIESNLIKIIDNVK